MPDAAYKFNPGEPTARIKSLHNDAPANLRERHALRADESAEQDYFLVRPDGADHFVIRQLR